MTETAGLKYMVTVAAAFLSRGWGILIGDIKDNELLADRLDASKGPAMGRDGNIAKAGATGHTLGIRRGKKGLGMPKKMGNCALADAPRQTIITITVNAKIYRFILDLLIIIDGLVKSNFDDEKARLYR